MAVNWEKYNKPVERRKPVIFLMNMSATEPGSRWSGEASCCERSLLRHIILDLIKDFKKNNLRVDVSIVGFGSGVNLLLPYTDICKIELNKLQETLDKFQVQSSAVFGTGLLAVKDMLEDAEETPENIYVPTVILLTTNEPSPGWENYLLEFVKEGRSSKCQRMAIFADCNDKNKTIEFGEKFFKDDLKEEKNKDEQFKNAFGFSLEAVMGRLDSFKQSNEKTSKIKNKASYAFADYGLQICFQPSGITETEMYKIRKKLSFEILDEEQPLIEVKKENVDIPILENAEFDGNNMDEDSFI